MPAPLDHICLVLRARPTRQGSYWFHLIIYTYTYTIYYLCPLCFMPSMFIPTVRIVRHPAFCASVVYGKENSGNPNFT